MHAPALRDPRAYVIPADQSDMPTATKFVNALRETGIAVNRATFGSDGLVGESSQEIPKASTRASIARRFM
jgi:hypothetical protein